MNSNAAIFAQDKDFWGNYVKGRPQPPPTLFDRIFQYHRKHGGAFGTVHDVGAGSGPYAENLREQFDHVILSDIVPENVILAKDRLGTKGFSYRAAKVEDVDDIPAGSVDMVFATNVMHFPPDQDAAMQAVAKQLKSGGTYACALFGPARFKDAKLQDLWERISQQGGRVLLRKVDNPKETIGVMARTQDRYNTSPLDPELFLPGAKRVNLNMKDGGIVGLLSVEIAEAYGHVEPDYQGPDDVETFEEEDGWSFETDIEGVKQHIDSFPFLRQNPSSFEQLFKELELLVGSGKRVRGYWPAKIILATRV